MAAWGQFQNSLSITLGYMDFHNKYRHFNIKMLSYKYWNYFWIYLYKISQISYLHNGNTYNLKDGLHIEIDPICLWDILYNGNPYAGEMVSFILKQPQMNCPNINHKKIIGPVFCLLLRASSDCAQPKTGQVAEATCPVIGWVQPELTLSKRQKTGPVPSIILHINNPQLSLQCLSTDLYLQWHWFDY